MALRLLTITAVLTACSALDNGLATTPVLGYNTWNCYGGDSTLCVYPQALGAAPSCCTASTSMNIRLTRGSLQLIRSWSKIQRISSSSLGCRKPATTTLCWMVCVFCTGLDTAATQAPSRLTHLSTSCGLLRPACCLQAQMLGVKLSGQTLANCKAT